MSQRQIDRFFKVLSENYNGLAKGKIRVILTGAAAGVLMGGNRPSIDIDFEIACNKKYLKDIESAIRRASELTGITANFSEDIDRWSEIAFLDYKKQTRAYKAFGAIEVSILSPEYWSIGKLARYLDPDIDDLVKVLKNNPLPPLKLARLLGKALLKSPRSSASFTFKKHVEHFFKTYGPSIWTKAFSNETSLSEFYRASGARMALSDNS